MVRRRPTRARTPSRGAALTATSRCNGAQADADATVVSATTGVARWPDGPACVCRTGGVQIAGCTCSTSFCAFMRSGKGVQAARVSRSLGLAGRIPPIAAALTTSKPRRSSTGGERSFSLFDQPLPVTGARRVTRASGGPSFEGWCQVVASAS